MTTLKTILTFINIITFIPVVFYLLTFFIYEFFNRHGSWPDKVIKTMFNIERDTFNLIIGIFTLLSVIVFAIRKFI